MAQKSKEKKNRTFRLAFIDDKTHEHLVTFHFSRTTFFITVVTILVLLCAAIYTITDNGLEPTKYEESMPYLLTKQFILNRERILDELLGDEE